MKKLIFKTLTVVSLAMAVTIYSCKKESTQQPQNPTNEFNVSVKNNLLVFKTINDYEAVVNNPSEETKKKFLTTVSSFKDFTSLAERNNQQAGYRTAGDGMDTLIKDEYFKSMLNTDLAVQIED